VLATLGPDGAPHGMAMWFHHTPDAILMLTVADLQKVRDLRRDPRVAVVAESVVDGGPCGVSVRGRAAILDESAERRAFVEAFLAKYHLDSSALGRPRHASNRAMFKIAPSHVRSWGLGDDGRRRIPLPHEHRPALRPASRDRDLVPHLEGRGCDLGVGASSATQFALSGARRSVVAALEVGEPDLDLARLAGAPAGVVR